MIRSELDVLLDKYQDPALRADLQTQIDRLKQRRSFGPVFEQHLPERSGCRVAEGKLMVLERKVYVP